MEVYSNIVTPIKYSQEFYNKCINRNILQSLKEKFQKAFVILYLPWAIDVNHFENKITKNVNSDDLINRFTEEWENDHDQDLTLLIKYYYLMNYINELKINFLQFVCLCFYSCITATLLHFIGNTYIIFKAKFSIFSKVHFPYFFLNPHIM